MTSGVSPQAPGSCCSYNLGGGTRPEVLLAPPGWLQAMRDHDDRGRPVVIDACIADAVRAVWDAGFTTLGSCCGHEGPLSRPSLILGDHETDVDGVRAVLAVVDGREWELLQWQLVSL